MGSGGLSKRLERLFELDRWTALAVGTYVLFTVVYLGAVPSKPVLHFLSYYAVEPVFLSITILALAAAARRSRVPELRAFFGGLIVAFAFWLVAALLREWLKATLGPEIEGLIRDSLFGLHYAVYLWSLEALRLGRESSRTERTVSLIGSLVLVGGGLIYLRILPEFAELGPYGSRQALYALFDFYLALRLGLFARRVGRAPLKATFGLLSVAMFLVTAADGLELAYQSGYLIYSEDSPLNALWVQHYLPLVLAARVRLQPGSAGFDASLAALRGRLWMSSYWGPLIAYGFGLPAAHVLIYSTGLGNPAAESLRGYFVLGWLVVLAVLIFVQHAAATRRLRASDRTLQRAVDRVRMLTSAREAAVEEERRRLSGELHGELAGALVELQAQLAWLSKHQPGDDPDVDRRLAGASDLVGDALGFAERVAAGLHPIVLEERGLAAALRALVEETAARGRLDTRVTTSSDLPEIAPERQLILYRIAQESLTNCLKHSGASRIELSLSSQAEVIELEIRDDGVGLDEPPGPTDPGLGLVGIRERVLAAGGTLEMGAGIGNRGLSIKAEVPTTGSGISDGPF